jgi:hypothetical protein
MLPGMKTVTIRPWVPSDKRTVRISRLTPCSSRNARCMVIMKVRIICSMSCGISPLLETGMEMP